MDDLRKFSLDIIKKNPELGGEIVDLFSMMMEEVEDGSSEELERDRFVCSVEELVNATIKTVKKVNKTKELRGFVPFTPKVIPSVR